MANIMLKHPDLPGRTIDVPEEKLWVYGESGWKRADGKPVPDGPVAVVEETTPAEVVELKEQLGPDVVKTGKTDK
jgi:hypothetical protein